MDLDFTAIICGATLVVGLIALIGGMFPPTRLPNKAAREIFSYTRSLFPVLLMVAILRSFIFEPFRIPSDSMMPGLVHGDFILVDKFDYGLRWPILNTKFISTGKPQRGDVIVFRSPSQPSIDLIKRLVGLPGDHVVVRDNRLTINGRLVPLAPGGTYSGGFGFHGSPLGLESFGEKVHVILLAADRWSKDFDGVVPPEHYFFMGDNRNDSEDSRFPDVGMVADANLVGHAHRIWMNWQIPGWPEWGRIGMKIR